jgi:hypothetical protein
VRPSGEAVGVVTAARRFRRAGLRDARKEYAAAYARQIAGCAARLVPMEGERNGLAALLAELGPREMELRNLLARAGIADGAIHVLVPDDDDKAAMLARGKVAAAEGDFASAAHATATANTRYLIMARERRVLLAEIEAMASLWTPDALSMLRSPPPGSLVFVYDGTATGHGVMALAPMSRGGAS